MRNKNIAFKLIVSILIFVVYAIGVCNYTHAEDSKTWEMKPGTGESFLTNGFGESGAVRNPYANFAEQFWNRGNASEQSLGDTDSVAGLSGKYVVFSYGKGVLFNFNKDDYKQIIKGQHGEDHERSRIFTSFIY